jgi:ferredoxin
VTYVTDALRPFLRDRDMFKWLPVVDPDKRTACGLCAAACGPLCLKMADDYPILTNAAACGTEEHCIGGINIRQARIRRPGRAPVDSPSAARFSGGKTQ